MEKQETIQEIRNVNYSWKDRLADKLFGLPYSQLDRDRQIDIDDMIEAMEE